MKKILLIAAFAFGVNASQAQYFTRTYGDAIAAPLFTDGFNTSVVSTGHIISNNSTNAVTGLVDPEVIKTDLTGASVFSNRYSLTLGGVTVNTTFTKVFELPGGTGYGVLGSGRLTTTGAEYIFFFQVNTSGGTVTSPYFYASSSPVGVYSAGSLNIVVSGNYVYAVYSNNTSGNFTLLKIDITTPTTVSGQVYTLPNSTTVTPQSIIVNPYTANELVVAGGIQTSSPANNIDAFILKINTNTLVASSYNYYDNGTNDYNIAYSIKPMSNVISGNNGFILAGTNAAAASDMDMWVMAVDQSLNVLNSSVIDYSTHQENRGFSIIERLNTLGSYEYYLNGYVVSAGNSNTLTVKLNSALALVTTFASTSNNETSYKVDQDNSSAAKGLALFGEKSGVLCINKLYFNGKTSCTFSNPTCSLTTISTSKNTTTVTGNNSFGAGTVTASVGTVRTISPVCYSTTVGGGSNTKVLHDDGNIAIAPNPANLRDLLTIQLNEETVSNNTPVSVSIFDLSGKLYYDSKAVVSPDHRIRLNLSEINLKEGVYFLKLSGQNINEHKVLRITN